MLQIYKKYSYVGSRFTDTSEFELKLPRLKDLSWLGMLIQQGSACDFCVWIGFDNDGNLELLSWLGIL